MLIGPVFVVELFFLMEDAHPFSQISPGPLTVWYLANLSFFWRYMSCSIVA